MLINSCHFLGSDILPSPATSAEGERLFSYVPLHTTWQKSSSKVESSSTEYLGKIELEYHCALKPRAQAELSTKKTRARSGSDVLSQKESRSGERHCLHKTLLAKD